MKLVPLGDRIVLKQLVAEETTKSGIVLPGQNKEKPQQAEVVAVGPGGMVDGKEVTMTWQEWSNCMIGNGAYAAAPNATKLSITAQLEEAFLKTYYRIPLCASTICSMLSFQCEYYTEEYNIMYGFGGMRLMDYKLDDVEWKNWVDAQIAENGELDYE